MTAHVYSLRQSSRLLRALVLTSGDRRRCRPQQPNMKPKSNSLFSRTWDAMHCSATAMHQRQTPLSPSADTDNHVIRPPDCSQSQRAQHLISNHFVVVLASHTAFPLGHSRSLLSEPLCRGDLMVVAADNDPLRPAPAVAALGLGTRSQKMNNCVS